MKKCPCIKKISGYAVLLMLILSTASYACGMGEKSSSDHSSESSSSAEQKK